MAQTPNPLQWAPPFYLAPPHFPHPTHHHKTRVHSNAPLTRTTTSFGARQLETPQQDQQQNDHIRPPEENYRKRASRMNWAKVAPHLKHTSSRTRSPTRATGYSPTLLPHNYAFNPYYHFYHHPKIPLTNPDSLVKSHQPSEVTEKMPMFYFNFASMPHDPMRTTQASPLPTFAAQIQTGHTTKTNVRDLAPITPFVNLMRSPTNQYPPYGSPMNPNTPVYTHHRLPHDFYHLYHRPQAENLPPPVSVPRSQQTPNSVPLSEDPKDGFGSYFKPELPVQFKPGNDPAEGLNDEGKSAAHSDPSYDGSSWEKWLEMVAKVNNVPEPLYMFPLPDEKMREEASVQDHFRASSMAQPLASPCSPGTGSHFHHTVSPGCFSFPVKECIVGEHFVFSLPEFAVEPKVVSPGDSGVSCALKRLTSNPHVYYVPLHGCGVTKQVIDALMIYQLELETCSYDNSLIRMLVECSLYPGFPPAETLLILDPLPLQYLVPLQLRIATDESYSFHPEAHRPLSGLRGRLVFMELSLLQPPDPSVVLRVHYCLAYTLTPYTSAMLIYDGCLPGSESQLLPSLSSNTRYIVVTSFLSLTSSKPSIVYDVDPEVYFFCLTEVCSSSDGVCSTGCINSSE
uniref:ZP domain-containing protein n=1 Tax=Neogobius melanostomus TaxID=47308 RepID=A0A8C6WIL0_9GOBI